jgi:hypothetical protein
MGGAVPQLPLMICHAQGELCFLTIWPYDVELYDPVCKTEHMKTQCPGSRYQPAATPTSTSYLQSMDNETSAFQSLTPI